MSVTFLFTLYHFFATLPNVDIPDIDSEPFFVHFTNLNYLSWCNPINTLDKPFEFTLSKSHLRSVSRILRLATTSHSQFSLLSAKMTSFKELVVLAKGMIVKIEGL